ncbi:MAG: hypothetical protein K2N89_06460 [Lachnospiraceae bacterium]|nr:hypothetical protein [Lachnospiraceae bacterium]
MDDQIKVVIDADFFRNITEHERGAGLFLQVMKDLGMKPFMHEFVANIELKGNIYLKQLLDVGEISIIFYKDYLNEENRLEYEEYFRQAYEKINCFEFPEKNDIYQYADQDESLGEIRSLYMASKMGYIYFMSDDADARTLAKKFFSSKRGVAIKTLFDVLILCKEKETKLRWKDINPTVTNAMQKRQDKVNKLKEIYS